MRNMVFQVGKRGDPPERVLFGDEARDRCLPTGDFTREGTRCLRINNLFVFNLALTCALT